MSTQGYVLGICGGSGSGKSYLVKNLEKQFTGGCIAVLDQDSYYKDLSYLSLDKRASTNFDHPNAIDFDQFHKDLISLLSRQSVNKPSYDFNTHTRTDSVSTIRPAPIVILEGLHIFHHEKLREKIDHKVFLDIESDIRFIRRLTRDTKERGRDIDSVILQYLDTVRPMEKKYIQPMKDLADNIINSTNYDEKFSKLTDLLFQVLKENHNTVI